MDTEQDIYNYIDIMDKNTLNPYMQIFGLCPNDTNMNMKNERKNLICPLCVNLLSD